MTLNICVNPLRYRFRFRRLLLSINGMKFWWLGMVCVVFCYARMYRSNCYL